MDRLEGGYLGAKPTWSTAASPGVWTLSQALARRAAGTWPATSSLFDPYFESVSLLLHMNGSNGSTAFVDSSLGNLAVTANGNAQISTAQSKFGGSSGLFDGTGDWLYSQAGTGDFNSGDFTIEGWYRFNSTVFNGGLFHVYPGAPPSSVNGLAVGFNNTNVFTIYSGGTPVSRTYAVQVDTWYHIALVRLNGSLTLYVNGIAQGASIADNTFFGGGNGVNVGLYYSSSYTFNGYIDEFRVTRGVARYTANFAVPGNAGSDEGAALYDPYFDYVSLLLRCNGDNNSTTFTDSSNNALAITRNGDAKISTTQARFGGASAYFDGTGDYLTASSPNLSGNWTVEVWVYPTTASQQTIVSFNNGSNSGINIWMNASRQLVVDDGANAQTAFTGGTLTLNAWNHVAVTRENTTTTGYINGTSAGNNSFTPQTTSAVSIGRYNGGVNFYYFVGYLDDLRITNGVARYTTNFRPVGPYATAGKLVDPYLTNTSLLLPMTGDNGTTSFFDRSNNFLRATENGNAKVSTAISKFGAGAAYFDGTGDYLGVPSTAMVSGTEDFTIEWWQKLPSAATTYSLARFSTINSLSGIKVGGTTLQFYVEVVGAINVVGTASFTTEWQHCAICRRSSVVKMFVDGTELTLATNTAPGYSLPSTVADIGRGWTSYGYVDLNGYLDDLRITKGVARYTAAFTPPERAFNDEAFNDPHYNNVSLLLHMDGTNNSTTFTDSSVNGLTVTANGDARISTGQSRFSGASAVFDKVDDRLTFPASPNFAFGTGDFTIEFWAYSRDVSGTGQRGFLQISATAGGLSTSYPGSIIISQGAGATGSPLNGGLFVSVNNVYASSNTPVLSTDTWYHIAVTRSSGTVRVFCNGILHASATSAGDLTANNLVVGGYYSTTYLFDGYIDELRITKGIARYTSNFTPPTLPFYNTTIPTVDPSFSSVSLLLHMNGTNGSTTFTDSSSNALTVTANGNAQISTAQSRFGGASGLFDGNGDFLAISNNTVFAFGTGDFTIEFWFYPISVTDGTMISGWSPSGSVSGFACNMSSGAIAFETAFNNTYISAAGPTAITANQWYHFAGVRSNGVARAFINGSSGTPINNSQSVDAQSSGVNIGWSTFTANRRAFNGYIDDLRITKGVARYTSNFYIPRAAFPDA